MLVGQAEHASRHSVTSLVKKRVACLFFVQVHQSHFHLLGCAEDWCSGKVSSLVFSDFQHQLGIQQFNSILTLTALSQCQTPLL